MIDLCIQPLTTLFTIEQFTFVLVSSIVLYFVTYVIVSFFRGI